MGATCEELRRCREGCEQAPRWSSFSVEGGSKLRNLQTVELYFIQELRLAPPCRQGASTVPDLRRARALQKLEHQQPVRHWKKCDRKAHEAAKTASSDKTLAARPRQHTPSISVAW